MKKKSSKKKRKNLFVFLKEFFSDVLKERKKIIWTSKQSLIKYSITTLAFMIFICLFFVGTDLIITLIALLKGLIG